MKKNKEEKFLEFLQMRTQLDNERVMFLKFKKGEIESDQDLDFLIGRFQELDRTLQMGGQEYHLVWSDNRRNLEQALEYKRSRL